MLTALLGWLPAFAWTQALEMPLYWRATRSLAVSFLASALTHPVVWFVFPQLMEAGWSYEAMVLAAEAFAVVVEAWWLHRNGVRRAWLWSLGVNAWSVTAGFALRAWTGWV